MSAQIVTTEDLLIFKKELIEELKGLLAQNVAQPKQWLRSSEVRKMLSVSPGTLQNLRINGTLPYTKVGGVIYYDQGDILKVLEENKIDNGL
ncbi:helix-turn-helix domain-containing protein [Catalinimonas sp. 4WD22]|uniref:helix-turn-helix domain-containing protein n=1 Tax=Catalinimonas locisalis TaxID=3133978 RepID=UPI003100D2DF